ncbi:hypothetical protein RZS08_13430, partial [Arthrospira platensis SPKY1]|nr:hypothetical protein [Arthrospira platensis SPKY1]
GTLAIRLARPSDGATRAFAARAFPTRRGAAALAACVHIAAADDRRFQQHVIAHDCRRVLPLVADANRQSNLAAGGERVVAEAGGQDAAVLLARRSRLHGKANTLIRAEGIGDADERPDIGLRRPGGENECAGEEDSFHDHSLSWSMGNAADRH